MEIQCGSGTNVGRKRNQNQDSFSATPELQLFVLADGMGGHRGGETASATAVEVITSSIRKAKQNGKWNAQEALIQAIRDANDAIFKRSVDEPQLQGMGTTTTALLIEENHLIVGHVGDSRCYFLRPNAVWQVTQDHSLVQEKLRAGIIKREEVRTDKMKNVITRSVGYEDTVDVEIYEMLVQSGDCFLLCSDGLSNLVEDQALLEVVQESFFNKGEIQKAVDRLIEMANENGGDDNITVILIQVT